MRLVSDTRPLLPTLAAALAGCSRGGRNVMISFHSRPGSDSAWIVMVIEMH
jgi:hypothetical protein